MRLELKPPPPTTNPGTSLPSPAPSSEALAQLTPAGLPQQPMRQNLDSSWFYDVFMGEGRQTVLDLYRMRGSDWFVRLVMNDAVCRNTPTAFVLKTSVMDVQARRARIVPFNLTARVESSTQCKTGTQVQFGYDTSKDTEADRLWYSQRGHPIADYVSLDSFLSIDINNLRSEFTAQVGKSPRLKAVVRDVLSLGGSITWTTIWEDPKTGHRTRVDIRAVMKGETSGQVGYKTSSDPLEFKSEIELQVRVVNPVMDNLSIERQYARVAQASQLMADLIGKEPAVVAMPPAHTPGSIHMSPQALSSKEWVGLSDGRQVVIGQDSSGQWWVVTPRRGGQGFNFYLAGDDYGAALLQQVRERIWNHAYSTVYDRRGHPQDNSAQALRLRQAAAPTQDVLQQSRVETPALGLKSRQWVGVPDGRQVLLGQDESGDWWVVTPKRDGRGFNFYRVGDEFSFALVQKIREGIWNHGYSTVYDKEGKVKNNSGKAASPPTPTPMSTP
jgi:hypothetical protein